MGRGVSTEAPSGRARLARDKRRLRTSFCLYKFQSNSVYSTFEMKNIFSLNCGLNAFFVKDLRSDVTSRNYVAYSTARVFYVENCYFELSDSHSLDFTYSFQKKFRSFARPLEIFEDP